MPGKPFTTDEVARRFPIGSRVKETRGNYGQPSPETFEVVGHSRGGVILRSSKGTTHHVDGRNVRRVGSTRRDALRRRRVRAF